MRRRAVALNIDAKEPLVGPRSRNLMKRPRSFALMCWVPGLLG